MGPASRGRVRPPRVFRERSTPPAGLSWPSGRTFSSCLHGQAAIPYATPRRPGGEPGPSSAPARRLSVAEFGFPNLLPALAGKEGSPAAEWWFAAGDGRLFPRRPLNWATRTG